MPGFDQRRRWFFYGYVAYRNSHCDTNEERICPKVDRHQAWILSKLMVETIRNAPAESKGKSHASRSNTEGYPPVRYEKAQVYFKSDQEKEQDEADIGGHCECRHRGSGEYSVCEARNASKHGGTQ